MSDDDFSKVYAAVRAARRNLDGTADLFFQRHTPSVIRMLESAETILLDAQATARWRNQTSHDSHHAEQDAPQRLQTDRQNQGKPE